MPVGGTRTRYVLSGSEEVTDLDGQRNVLRRFIPGAAIDERVAQIDANGAVTFIHNDKQNSVIAISDAVGNPVVRRGYGTYGETDPAQMVGTTSAGTSAHPFGYTGRRWDPDLGLYYYRARWYDPQLGTFLQTDPIGEMDYVNLYAYVGLEPGNAVDPTGMCGDVGKPAIDGCEVTKKTGGYDDHGIENLKPNNTAGVNGHAISGDGSPREGQFGDYRLDDLGGALRTEAQNPSSSLAGAIASATETGRPTAFTTQVGVGALDGKAPLAQQLGVGRIEVVVSGTLQSTQNGVTFSATVRGITDSQDYQSDSTRNPAGSALTAAGAALQKADGGSDYKYYFRGSQSIKGRFP
jgi:RHS repeat-associated protein